ncbi:hypothetical protein J4558_00115 [Leptolyngbya sp. 15MV]|nr:hypothetical protein J4558_00115 [Leptolyngbya sp. 15MV]
MNADPSRRRAQHAEPKMTALEMTAPAVRPEIVSLTPELARSLLSTSRGNRPMRPARVAALVRAITNGQWHLNGEAIVIDADGVLLNGHHRCYAVLQCGRAIPTLLVRGVAPEAFFSFDRHSRRSPGDVLALRGVKHATLMAAALRWLREYLESRHDIGMRKMDSDIPALLTTLEQHPEMPETVAETTHFPFASRLLSPGLVGFFGYAAAASFDRVAPFLAALQSGAELAETSPIFQLRKRLLEGATGYRKMDLTERYVLLAKAWAAWRAGESVQVLRWRRAGPAAEPVPKLVPDRWTEA